MGDVGDIGDHMTQSLERQRVCAYTDHVCMCGGGCVCLMHLQLVGLYTCTCIRFQLRRQQPFSIVEWTLVNDKAQVRCNIYTYCHVIICFCVQYLAFSSNLTQVVLRAIEIANGVDLVS